LNEAGRHIRILVDGHGGDHAPTMVVEALARVLEDPATDIHYGITGQPEVLEPVLKAHDIDAQVEIVPASQVIEMCEAPASVLRAKKDSSMHVGLYALREGLWDAFVSAGNTGALMAISKVILKTLPGIDRPALASMLPNIDGRTLLLDAGANVGCHSEHLIQFAMMGSCYMQYAEGIESPRVGLLNIGVEEMKGNDVIKVAAAGLKEMDLNFIGNVEGTDIFSEKVDVVVCDGFVGNVALKAIEGTADFILYHLKKELSTGLMAKIGMFFARNAIRQFRININPNEYNGAPLLGLNGIVVKSHGCADSKGFAHAMEIARREVDADMRSKISETLHE
jgi:glycerol-3-phosphate acyltransferase PlsX